MLMHIILYIVFSKLVRYPFAKFFRKVFIQVEQVLLSCWIRKQRLKNIDWLAECQEIRWNSSFHTSITFGWESHHTRWLKWGKYLQYENYLIIEVFPVFSPQWIGVLCICVYWVHFWNLHRCKAGKGPKRESESSNQTEGRNGEKVSEQLLCGKGTATIMGLLTKLSTWYAT